MIILKNLQLKKNNEETEKQLKKSKKTAQKVYNHKTRDVLWSRFFKTRICEGTHVKMEPK